MTTQAVVNRHAQARGKWVRLQVPKSLKPTALRGVQLQAAEPLNVDRINLTFIGSKGFFHFFVADQEPVNKLVEQRFNQQIENLILEGWSEPEFSSSPWYT